MRRWSVALGFAALLTTAVSARAYTLEWLGAKLGNGASFPDGGGDRFVYLVDETQGMPGGLNVPNMQRDIETAFDQWSNVSCSYIGARFGGAITDGSQLGTHSDTKSVIASFISNTQDPRFDSELGAGIAVGVALTYTVNGIIEGCDVEYNAVDWSYADDGTATAIDFPSVAQHETGHCFGLAHAPDDSNSVMYPDIAAGTQRRTLDARDIDNLCQLYPVTGGLGSPCAGASCAAPYHCILDTVQGGDFCSHGCDVNVTTPGADGGCEVGFGCKASTEIASSSAACFPGQGDQAQVGGPCVHDTDCVGAAAVCINSVGPLAYPAGYCSQACGGNACPYGNTCVQIGADSSGNPQSYCLNDCNAVTGGCRAGYSCNPVTADGNGFCYPSCQTDTDCGGAACLCNGVCVSVGKPSAYIGAPCAANTDCPTGAFCIPGTLPGGLPSGWSQGYCAESCGGTNACVTCPQGSACVVDGQEGQAYCLQLCSASGGCRSGYGCGSTLTTGGEVEVCQPGDGSACIDSNSCPVGEVRVQGACQLPGADGGCQGALCPLADGGVGVVGLEPDAGPGAMTPVKPLKPGCGCTSSSPGLPLVLPLLAALRRRKRW